MTGSQTQPPRGHPDPSSLEYLCHFPGDLVAAPCSKVLAGAEAAGLDQDAHQQLDELFRDRLRESVACGAMALWGSLDKGAPRGYGHACPVLLAGPSRKVPAVLRARSRDLGGLRPSLELDLFVRVPRSVARHNGMALPAKDPGYDEPDAPERPYAVIKLTGSQARRLLANAKAYTHGACQHPHVSSILLNMSAKHLLARADAAAPADGAAPLAATDLNLVCLPPLDGDLEKCLCMLGHSRSFAADGNGSESDDAKSDSVPLNRMLDGKVWGKTVARSEEIAALFQRCGDHPLLQSSEVAELLTSTEWCAPESAFAGPLRALVQQQPPVAADDLQPSSGDEDDGTVSPPLVASAPAPAPARPSDAKGKRKATAAAPAAAPAVRAPSRARASEQDPSDDEDEDDDDLDEPSETSEEEDEDEEEAETEPEDEPPPPKRLRCFVSAPAPAPAPAPAAAPAPAHDDLAYLRAQLRTTAIPALQRLLAPAVRDRLGFFAVPLEENVTNLMRTDSGHETPHVTATLIQTIVNMGHAFAHFAEQRDANDRVPMLAAEATRIRELAKQAHAVTSDTLPQIHDALRQAQALEQALLSLKDRGSAVLAGIAQGGPCSAAEAAAGMPPSPPAA